MKNSMRIPALLAVGASFAILSCPSALAEDKCTIKAVLGGKPVTMTHCAAAIYDDQHSVTLYFSDTLFTPDELSAFHGSSHAVDKTADGKPRTMMHFAFCPGAGKTAANAASVKSVETSVNLAGAFLTGRQWLFELPREKEMLKVEKLTGDVVPGGKISGRITGGKMSDGLKYSWEADFDFTLPAKSASAGIGGCGD